MPVASPPPIDVMAVRPLMVRTAARVGDGLSISMGASHTYLAETVRDAEEELRAQGRERTSFRIAAAALCVVSDDPEAACRQVAPLFSVFEPSMLEYLARGALEPGALVSASQSGGANALIELLTPQVMREIALVSTPEMLGDALERYAASGIDELAVSIAAASEEQVRVVEQLSAARAWTRQNKKEIGV
jgi:alkanesulfonate monooxygenase SsuD/methylene tetrahydromethanopterin reductase-like flavin-dependent oxidoreductase (luciferase family)